MTTGFRRASDGIDEMEVDPYADKDFRRVWADWLAGDTIASSEWIISPAITGVPHTKSVNGGPVTIDGVEYPAGTVTTCWVKDLQAGTVYTVANRITTAAGRRDERSFRLICREL